MTICCETTTMTDVIARKLLKIVDRWMNEHFFQINGLRQIGRCSHDMLDRRSLIYYKEKQVFQKSEVTEFYWFNNLRNRFNKQQIVT